MFAKIKKNQRYTHFMNYESKGCKVKVFFFDELYLSSCEKHYNQCVANDYFIKNFK